jgi:hypothetical protein
LLNKFGVNIVAPMTFAKLISEIRRAQELAHDALDNLFDEVSVEWPERLTFEGRCYRQSLETLELVPITDPEELRRFRSDRDWVVIHGWRYPEVVSDAEIAILPEQFLTRHDDPFDTTLTWIASCFAADWTRATLTIDRSGPFSITLPTDQVRRGAHDLPPFNPYEDEYS